MAEPIKVEGIEELQALARALKTADAELRKATRAALRNVSKQVGMEVMREAAQRMPARGGLRGLLEQAKPGFRFSGSAEPSLAVLLKDRGNHDLASLDAGILRHPVFARAGKPKSQWTWRPQTVPEHAYTDAFEHKAAAVRAELLAQIEDALTRIAAQA